MVIRPSESRQRLRRAARRVGAVVCIVVLALLVLSWWFDIGWEGTHVTAMVNWGCLNLSWSRDVPGQYSLESADYGWCFSYRVGAPHCIWSFRGSVASGGWYVRIPLWTLLALLSVLLAYLWLTARRHHYMWEVSGQDAPDD